MLRSVTYSAERNKKILHFLGKRLSSGNRRLLDIGCDDGEFSIAMGEAAGSANIWGIEIVESQAAAARKAGLLVESV